MINPEVISLIVPAYNEEATLELLYRRIAALDWSQLNLDFELLVVDDHSTDHTPALLRKLAAQDSRVKWIRFSRNFGSHKAVTAGFEHASGAAAISLAADLQSPPETIPSLVAKWRQGFNIVWAVRENRAGEGPLYKLLAGCYYALMRRFSLAEIAPKGADFLLLDRRCLQALKSLPERHTSILALIQWMGFRQGTIVYTKDPRHAGQSKWTLSRRVKLAVDSFVSFSYAPIRLMSLTGFIFALLGLGYAVVLVSRALFYGSPMLGWTSLICVVLVTSGIQLIMLGILGEYLWRTFDESRSRPRYIIEAANFAPPAD